MDPDTSHVYMAHQRFGLNQTQVGEYELVDNHQHLDIATPHSPSTPDLLYPHTHLTAPANLPINQNGLPVLSTAEVDEHGLSAHPTSAAAASRPDLDLDLERQHALFYSSDLLNSNISVDLAIGLDDNLSNVGSADHLIHGGHGNFLSVNNSRTFLQDNQLYPRAIVDPVEVDEVPLSPLEPRCCGGRLPASVVNKLNKLSARSGLIKMVGEFGLRENLYYGSIFICMTLIVIVCFLVINNGGGAGLISGSGSAAAYDGEQRCELIGDPVHGEVHQTGRYLGDRAIYTCATGWEIVGAEERVCQANGAWTNREPFCKKRVYCLDPPVVQHATHNGPPEATSFPLETVLKYACYPGYVTVGFAHAKCFLYNDTAQWFGPDITCKAIRCSDPDPVENGDVDRKCQTFGCRISYKCRAGYELDGRQHRYCQADGSWSPRLLPQCLPIQCERPSNPLNGRAIYDSVSYNSLISYECNYGYMLIGDSVRRCERNKMWTGTEPTCKEINCGSPGILPNGWLEGTRTTLHAVVTFRCQEGMTFEGPSYRTICQADGRWSHPLPRCYAPCVVPHISHGFVADRASGSSVPHTQTIDVRCLSQFQKTHNSTPVCKNGTWSRIPKCIPAKCTELPEAPENGLVVAPNLDHGMVGKFECRDGYMLKGHNTTQCFFGNWTGMTPWCKEVFCPFPGFVENGKVLLVGAMGLYEYRPYVRKIRNNRQIMFQCDRGFALVGGPTGATCIDGHWSPSQLPRCQESSHTKAKRSAETAAASASALVQRRHFDMIQP